MTVTGSNRSGSPLAVGNNRQANIGHASQRPSGVVPASSRPPTPQASSPPPSRSRSPASGGPTFACPCAPGRTPGRGFVASTSRESALRIKAFSHGSGMGLAGCSPEAGQIRPSRQRRGGPFRCNLGELQAKRFAQIRGEPSRLWNVLDRTWSEIRNTWPTIEKHGSKSIRSGTLSISGRNRKKRHAL